MVGVQQATRIANRNYNKKNQDMGKKLNENKFILILVIFITIISILNLISTKIVTLFGYAFSVGTFLYALTFPCTDIISEVWGKERAKRVVWLGFLSNVIIAAVVFAAVKFPPAEFWAEENISYVATFSAVPRLIFASMIAFLISQLHDVWAFHYIRQLTKGKYLWLRNNVSTWVSQIIDSFIIVIIAFYGTVPLNILIEMIFATTLIKIVIAALDTPVVYALVKWAKT